MYSYIFKYKQDNTSLYLYNVLYPINEEFDMLYYIQLLITTTHYSDLSTHNILLLIAEELNPAWCTSPLYLLACILFSSLVQFMRERHFLYKNIFKVLYVSLEYFKNVQKAWNMSGLNYALWHTKILTNCIKWFKTAEVLILILIFIQMWRTRKSFLNPPLLQSLF